MQQTISLNFQGYWRTSASANIPAQSGVYLVYVGQYDAYRNLMILSQLIYIGEAANANQRILTHEKWAMWRNLVPLGYELCFSFAPAWEATRKRSEAALINLHKPACNVEFKTHFPYENTTVWSTGACLLLKPLATAVKSVLPLPLRLGSLATPSMPARLTGLNSLLDLPSFRKPGRV